MLSRIQKRDSDLRESEQRLELVIEGAELGMWDWNIVTGDLILNDRWPGMLGYAMEEITPSKDTWDELLHPADKERVYSQLNAHLAKGTEYAPEFRMKTRSGEWLWIHARGKVVKRSDEGEALRMLGIHLDISRHKMAEESILKERDMAQRYLDLAGTMLIALDVKGRITLINKKGCDLLGYREEELINNIWFDNFFEEENRDEVMSVFHEIISGVIKQFEYYENKVRTKNGEQRLFAWHNTLLYDDQGNIIGTLSSAEDITDRKRNEEEMVRMRNLLNNIFNSMPSVLVGVDPEGRITQWNHEAERVTKISADDSMGKIFTDVFPLIPDAMNKIREVIERREPVTDERIVMDIDGSKHFTDVTAYPLISNGINGAVIRIDDVTQRVRLEEIMLQTEKMMSVGGLAAGMAHEINNPLGIIYQGIQNIIRRLSPDNNRNLTVADKLGIDLHIVEEYMKERHIIKYLQGIEEAVARSSLIIKNMLDFSRHSKSKMGEEDINELIDNTIFLAENDYDLKKKYDFKYIDIQRDYDDSLGKIICTKTEIEQVLLNLLKNSAHAMTRVQKEFYSPAILIKTQLKKDYIVIELSDNGPGMDEEIRKRILNRSLPQRGWAWERALDYLFLILLSVIIIKAIYLWNQNRGKGQSLLSICR